MMLEGIGPSGARLEIVRTVCGLATASAWPSTPSAPVLDRPGGRPADPPSGERRRRPEPDQVDAEPILAVLERHGVAYVFTCERPPGCTGRRGSPVTSTSPGRRPATTWTGWPLRCGSSTRASAPMRSPKDRPSMPRGSPRSGTGRSTCRRTGKADPMRCCTGEACSPISGFPPVPAVPPRSRPRMPAATARRKGAARPFGMGLRPTLPPALRSRRGLVMGELGALHVQSRYASRRQR